MITGKIILKSATKLSLDQRFGEIAKHVPPTPRIQQQTNVIIPQTRQDLFANKRSATLNIANRLKKRSINYRRGMDNNAIGNRPFTAPRTPRVFQRLSFGNRRRGGGGGANSYLFGGQSGMGVRLGVQGRVGTRIFHSRKRGFINNNTGGRFGGFQRRGNNNNYNNQGRRFGNRPNRGRGGGGGGRGGGDRGRGNRGFSRGRGNGRFNNRNNNSNNNRNVSKETLDNDLEKYMAQTKLDTDSVDMNAV
ncbi:hypothetical protein I4U23_008293 [Adineta vaga]|nr:hypothetical protein I4U23_008293 [Adineta vaga]